MKKLLTLCAGLLLTSLTFADVTTTYPSGPTPTATPGSLTGIDHYSASDIPLKSAQTSNTTQNSIVVNPPAPSNPPAFTPPNEPGSSMLPTVASGSTVGTGSSSNTSGTGTNPTTGTTSR